MHEAHDALLCIAEGRTLSERDRRRVTPEHWFKPAADMRTLFADLPEACDNTLAIARRCAVMAETRKPLLPVCPKVRPGQTEEETVRAMAMEGLERRMDAMAADAATREIYRARLEYELDVIANDGLFRLLPHRRRLHPVVEGAGHPGRPGPRFGRRIGRRLGADHHRPRSAAVQPAVRAVPQPRTRVDARLRHRLLPGRPRPRHRLCPQRIRRRPRRPDHHLRKTAGPRRGPRRRPRAGSAVRPGQQSR